MNKTKTQTNLIIYEEFLQWGPPTTEETDERIEMTKLLGHSIMAKWQGPRSTHWTGKIK